MKNNDGGAPIRGLTDSHFHSLSMREKGIDPVSAIKAAKKNGLAEMIDIGLHPRDLDTRRALLHEIEGVYFSSGIAPAEAAHDDWKNRLRELEKQAGDGKILAIGELGLDWYRNYGSKESQMALMEAQLEIAKAKPLPIIIHNRDADSEILALLRSADLPAAGILHCFSSDYGMAAKCIDLGYLISFAGNVTYKNATLLCETAAKIPSGSLLLETDAPYLSPQPVRGSVNTPKHIVHTYELIASVRDVSVQELARAVRSNLRSCLKIGPLTS